ncbi:MAG: ABC transporter substrate-binding protein [Bryobacteraceae bacterium]|nr:ABC transporter substrate-binding protein [Bryobacteraceae bacterium]
MRILVSRHSAFYSPLISTIAGGFLGREGLEATYGVLPAGRTSRDAIRSGEADVIQSAVSSSFGPLEKGETDLPPHVAQINCRDGFFLVGKRDEGGFEWRTLEGRSLLADHGGQPLAMLRYAARLNGVDWSRIRVIDAGKPERMAEAFRGGGADFVHLQGPAAQQLEIEGVGRVAARVGAAMPEVAFSSLAASREFIDSEEGGAFLRAYESARRWVRSAAAEEVAAAEASFFPGVAMEDLTAAIAAYQGLGCWEGEVEIPRDLFEQAVNVFESTGAIARRPRYEDVVYSRANWSRTAGQ